MMNRILFSLSGLLLTVNWTYATLIGPRALMDLKQNADLILVGSGNWTIQRRQVIAFTIEVNRVLKGDPAIAGKT
ncbi:MAG TPA: hypothetical protein VK789_20515 [Bryobacteraceae bacterium]|nr:hypothetical protein [Bryobacteraceae bacterium]